MSDNFYLYSKYYDLLYKSKDFTAEANNISDCIKNNNVNAKTILEFGSGTCKHGLILKNIGYEIYGFERSKQMVDEDCFQGFPCEQADITILKLTGILIL
jgi:hypothetical protein